jgi:hypothetical protein
LLSRQKALTVLAGLPGFGKVRLSSWPFSSCSHTCKSSGHNTRYLHAVVHTVERSTEGGYMENHVMISRALNNVQQLTYSFVRLAKAGEVGKRVLPRLITPVTSLMSLHLIQVSVSTSTHIHLSS